MTNNMNGSTFFKDLSAGVVVFLVALPLCLGIALASNAPLISGLIAGIVGGLIVSWISGSHTSVSGPAAGLTAIVFAQIEKLGSYEAFLGAVILAGVLQLVMGWLRAGQLLLLQHNPGHCQAFSIVHVAGRQLARCNGGPAIHHHVQF